MIGIGSVTYAKEETERDEREQAHHRFSMDGPLALNNRADETLSTLFTRLFLP